MPESKPVRIDAKLHGRLKVIAAERQKTMTEIVEEAIKTKLREMTELPYPEKKGESA